jgi:hypothetical protein
MEVFVPTGNLISANVLAVLATLIRTALFGGETLWFAHSLSSESSPSHRAARALWLQRRIQLVARAVLFAGATFLGLATLTQTGALAAGCATGALVLTSASQLIERYFYFVASEPFRMPGPVPLLRDEKHS